MRGVRDFEAGEWERARYWRHPAAPGIDLLRARFVDHVYGRHFHETYVVGVIGHGVEEFAYRGATHRAGPGQVVLVNPGEVHTGHAGVPEGWAYRVLYPMLDVVAGLAAELDMSCSTPYFPDAVVDDNEVARLLRVSHRAAEDGDQLTASTLLRNALTELLRRHARPSVGSSAEAGAAPAAPAAVAAARELLHERVVEPPSLDELAADVGERPFRLLRAFKHSTGLPPHAYLNQLRVQRARSLLDAGQRAADVAADVGFADQAHLTRHFKRIVGVPPGTYARDCKIVQARAAGAP